MLASGVVALVLVSEVVLVLALLRSHYRPVTSDQAQMTSHYRLVTRLVTSDWPLVNGHKWPGTNSGHHIIPVVCVYAFFCIKTHVQGKMSVYRRSSNLRVMFQTYRI